LRCGDVEIETKETEAREKKWKYNLQQGVCYVPSFSRWKKCQRFDGAVYLLCVTCLDFLQGYNVYTLNQSLSRNVSQKIYISV